jgi:superfamily II DNA/RNA helicase
MLRKFNDGQIQVMVNVGVLTEGFDSPAVEVIVQARPTKSRCLYSQMIGRATRPLPGTVDGDGKELPETRREHIAASSKPAALVVDFAGNAGRHKLVTTADLLGGKSSEEAIERAKKKATASGKPEDMAALIDEEEQNLKEEAEERKRREAARKAHLIGKARFSVKTINPFDLWDMTPARERGWDAGKHLSEKQTALLLKQGIDPAGMPYAQAKQVLNQLFYRWSAKLATLKQCNTVKRFYPETDVAKLTMTEATKMIDAVAQNGWKRPAAPVAVTEDVGF